MIIRGILPMKNRDRLSDLKKSNYKHMKLISLLIEMGSTLGKKYSLSNPQREKVS